MQDTLIALSLNQTSMALGIALVFIANDVDHPY